MAEHPAATTSRKRSGPGRKRRLLGWVLLAFGVLIAGVWGASAKWWFGFGTAETSVAAGDGVIWMQSPRFRGSWFAVDRTQVSNRWSWFIDRLALERGPEVTRVNLGVVAYQHMAGSSSLRFTYLIPWPFALASLLGGGWLVWSGRRARRRAMTNVCLKCGYDLAGLAPGAPCPECGILR